LSIVTLFVFVCFSQNQSAEPVDSALLKSDTLKSIFVQTNPPVLYSVTLHNSRSAFGRKVLCGFGYSLGLNLTLSSFLLIAPDNITKWGRSDKFKLSVIRSQYIRTFTLPPVFDRDLWYINYVGHPYQGTFYYNAMRSQGAGMLESSVFCFAQSCLWEYVWEGGMEQPSIQDLIVTPILGSLVGELSHIATVNMAKNGYTWYEKVVVCVINPTYALNNGFKLIHRPGL